MTGIVWFAKPWWVNLLILIPAVPWLLSRKGRAALGWKRLAVTALFGIAFGLVEASVVVYLRVAIGLVPGRPAATMAAFPAYLLQIECWREAATMAMLAAVACVAGRSARERMVAFLWTFAWWDIFYYVWLRLTIGWPGSMKDMDVLFLIPEPWVAEVWYPLVVSGLTAIAIGICSRPREVPGANGS